MASITDIAGEGYIVLSTLFTAMLVAECALWSWLPFWLLTIPFHPTPPPSPHTYTHHFSKLCLTGYQAGILIFDTTARGNTCDQWTDDLQFYFQSFFPPKLWY